MRVAVERDAVVVLVARFHRVEHLLRHRIFDDLAGVARAIEAQLGALLQPLRALAVVELAVLVVEHTLGQRHDVVCCRLQVLVVFVRVTHGDCAVVRVPDLVGRGALVDRDLQDDDPVAGVREPIAALVRIRRGRVLFDVGAPAGLGQAVLRDRLLEQRALFAGVVQLTRFFVVATSEVRVIGGRRA